MAVRRQPISPSSSDLLNVVLQAFRQRVVDDPANVGLVDAHSVGDGGDEDLDSAGEKGGLSEVSLVGGTAGVVAVCLEVAGAEVRGQRVALVLFRAEQVSISNCLDEQRVKTNPPHAVNNNRVHVPPNRRPQQRKHRHIAIRLGRRRQVQVRADSRPIHRPVELHHRANVAPGLAGCGSGEREDDRDLELFP